MGRVLVLDSQSIAAVAIVRSLARHGIEVACGAEDRTSLAFFSKYVRQRHVYPSPKKAPDLFIRKICELVKQNEYDVVMPVTDETTVVISKYKADLSKFSVVPICDYDTIMKGRDKGETLRVAVQNGIPCPKTHFPEEQDLRDIRSEVEYPVLVRPRQSSGARGIVYVGSAEEFIPSCNAVETVYKDFMIQEYVPHDRHYSVCVLLDQHSDLMASFAYRELRHYSSRGSSATYAVSVKQPELLEYSVRLLKLLGWSGVANLEFVFDERDGEPKLLEINPRFWMSLELAIQSGVDFPYLLYQLSTDGRIETVDDYKVGVKYRWLLPADVVWLWRNRTRVSAFRQFFRFYERDLHYAVLSLTDPGPMVGTIFQSFRFLVSREKRDFIFQRGW